MSDGYTALHSGAALLDLSTRGRIEATGEDRARLIHALTTNHIQQLQPGQGAYAFFLTAQGRIIADAHVLCFADKLMLDVEPEVRATLYPHIDHYIIADDVTLDDVTDRTFELAVEGPQARAVLEGHVPEQTESHVSWGPFTVARISSTGAEGFRIFGEGESPREKLIAAGAVPATPEDARTVRIEHFLPRYGEDITNKALVQETGLMNAVHFSKGCYLGQEIVERIRSRTQVNRMLGGLEIETGQPVAPGTKVTSDGAPAGEITSSAYSPERGKTVAIAMLRMQFTTPGTTLDAAGSVARTVLPSALR